MIFTGMVISRAAPRAPLAPSIWGQAMQSVPTWMHAMIASLVGWTELLFSPISMPILFLTLLIGHELFMNANTAFKGIFLNKSISIVFFLLSLFLQSIIALVALAMKYVISGTMAGIFVEGISCALLMIVVTTGYLWGREMFEGEKENAPARSQLRVLIHANQNT